MTSLKASLYRTLRESGINTCRARLLSKLRQAESCKI